MKQAYSTLIFLAFLPLHLIAQSNNISGRVTDATSGAPMLGVSVMINTSSGQRSGTTTDQNGNYMVVAPANATALVFTFTGMETITEQIRGRNTIDVIMKASDHELQQVVVVGYGTQKKANLTGSVDQVTAEVLDNRSITNLNQGLQGVLPNLNIRMLDGKPNQAPSFNIRGATSIGQGGSALVLVDGVEGDPSLLNPNDVATVTILKDAGSAAIYGARGAFGVVLITTKNPAKGRTSITYTANLSSKQATAVPDFVNDAYTWAKLFAESSVAWDGTFPQAVNKTLKFSQAYLNELERRSKIPGLPEVEIDPNTGEYVYYASTDWYRELYKENNKANEHNLTISGSGDKTTFLLTGRYFAQEGLFRYNSDDYQMLNFRAKGSVQVYPWLRIDNNTDFASMKYHNPLNVGEGGGIWRNIADEGHPLAPLLNPDGTLTFSSAYTVGDFYYGKNGIDQTRGILKNTTSFTAQFFNNTFKLRGDITYQKTNNNETRKQVPVPYSIKPGVIAYIGASTNDIRESRRETQYFASNIYGEYEKTFNRHYFKGLLGYNYEQSTFKGLTAQRNGLIFENANDINLALGQSFVTGGGFEEWAILGGFGRFNYVYNDRYLLEINGRYDGSSKFPTDQRYGFFPSVSAAWRISKEAFWHVSPRFISDFKIRGSYGSLGNGNVASYTYQEQLIVNAQTPGIINGARPSFTSRPSVLPAGLTWETSTTQNLGLDLTMLSNRLRFVGDMYTRKTTDMFTIGVTLPAVFGATSPRGNYADLETKGWEAMLSWTDKFNLASEKFNYDVRLTLADNSAIITKYNNPDKRLNDYYEGMKVGEIWGYTTVGFFATAEEITKHADQKLFLSTSTGQTFPGDIKLLDKNGDGVVNPGLSTANSPGDRSIIGNSSARYLYGINLSGDWNNFFLSAFFQGVGKQDWFPSTEAGVFWGQYNRPYGKIPRWQLDNRWTPTNQDALLPRYVSRLANRNGGILREAQTRYILSIAYLRLKNIQLGYNLPQNLISRIKATNARVYISAENIWTWSPLYKITRDLDPEGTGPSDQVFSPNGNAGDGYNYPMLKGVTFGLSITF